MTLCLCFGNSASRRNFSAKVEAFNSSVLGENTKSEDIPSTAIRVMDNAALMPALPKLKLALQGSEIKLKRGSSEVYLTLYFTSLVYIAKSEIHKRTLAVVTEEFETQNASLTLKCHIFKLCTDSKSKVDDVYNVLEGLLSRNMMAQELQPLDDSALTATDQQQLTAEPSTDVPPQSSTVDTSS